MTLLRDKSSEEKECFWISSFSHLSRNRGPSRPIFCIIKST